MQEFLEFLLDLIYLKSRKRGPLVFMIDIHDQHVHLTLENKGKRKIAFAAARCQDGNGKQHFPSVDLAAGTVLHPGRPETLRIAASELRSLGCQRLAVLDTTGHAWAVEGFDGTALGT
mgnify:CR=1 FL=1